MVSRVASLANSGRYADLQAVAAELVAVHPESGFAWKALAVSLAMQGKEALQPMMRAASLLPNDADCHSNLGSALRQAGRLPEAAASYQRALVIRPLVAEIWSNLGNVFKEVGRFDDAFAAYHKALELKPGFSHAHNNLGNAYRLVGKLEEAVDSYARAIALDPAYTEAQVNLGIVRRLQNRTASALESCQRALEQNSGLAAAWRLRADLYSDQGDFAAAENAFRQALAIEPDSPEAWAGIAGLRRMSVSDHEWLAGAERIAARATPAEEVYLRYALGKYFDDVGDYEQAFANYRRANELSAATRARHDRHGATLGLEAIIRDYGGNWLREASTRNFSERPVFVVGMPRSGTTLAEQILAAHPQVFGAGELSFWNTAFANLHASRVGEAPVAAGTDHVEAWANEYLAELHALCANAARVVDKMPGNFLYLGLIHAALPKARVIHMRRHPIDTCLSIYFQNFGAVHPYATDLEDLAHYYREYSRLVDHWRSLLPAEALLEVPYEGLVQQPEYWSRRMVEFLGLPWDAACLEFQENRRPVNTFSKWQTRQKISTSSVARWRRYESFVGPLRSLEAPVAGES
jgi:tetratricopeptide (TPR) repeat protein